MGACHRTGGCRRFGRRVLELGGNNAMVVTPHANLDMATRAILFGAVGTAGQRCTSLRRLIVHRSVKDALLSRVLPAYESLGIGNPLEAGTLVGPLIDKDAFDNVQGALERRGPGRHGVDRRRARAGGGVPRAYYVRPAIADMGRRPPA